MKSIHTFDVFAPTDEQEEAMNKKRGGHYRRGKNKEMELEAPNGRITKEKGTRFGEVINKGIEQVRDWQMYIAANWNVIVAELEKHSFSNTKLPRQLYKYCPYQIYYAVIAGLRKDFENIRDRKLQLQNENNITLLHYENLIDVANEN